MFFASRLFFTNMYWGRGLPSSEKLAEYWFEVLVLQG